MYADSLGNGLFEHLLLCRKYGIIPTFEAPALGFELPFLPDEFTGFEEIYRSRVQEMKCWIRRAEAVYGQPILQRDSQPWVVWCPLSPLALFARSVERNPIGTAEVLKNVSGSLRLHGRTKSPAEQLLQFQATRFIRQQHARVLKVMSDTLRESVPGAMVIGNMHTLPPVDYDALHDIFDHPGVAVRPGYLDEAPLREPYIAYATRLFADLTGRSPIVSIRANITAAGTRVVAGPEAISQWFDASLRQGVAGYYLWPVDYPIHQSAYRGPMSGNPHPVAHGRERWQALLDNFKLISKCRRFTPPPAEIGILVPYDVMATPHWLRVMSTFIELQTARIAAQLVSSRQVEAGSKHLRAIKALVIPTLAYASDHLIRQLGDYVGQGGAIIVPQRGLSTRGMDARPIGSLCDGRTITIHAPACEAITKQGNCMSHLSKAAAEWRRLAARLVVASHKWVFSMTSGDLSRAAGAPKESTPAPEPELAIPHYLYEHSSDWILPYLEPTNGKRHRSAGGKAK